MPINASVTLCGAKTRRNNGQPCMQPAMKNGRCRMHGGKSTGPKTLSGKDRSAMANFKHGFYTNAVRKEREQMRIMMQWRDDLMNV